MYADVPIVKPVIKLKMVIKTGQLQQKGARWMGMIYCTLKNPRSVVQLLLDELQLRGYVPV